MNRKSCRRVLQRNRAVAAGAAANRAANRPSVSHAPPHEMGDSTSPLIDGCQPLSSSDNSFYSSGIPTLEDILVSNPEFIGMLDGGATLDAPADTLDRAPPLQNPCDATCETAPEERTKQAHQQQRGAASSAQPNLSGAAQARCGQLA